MKRASLALLLLAVVMFCISCSNKPMEKEIERFMGTKVELRLDSMVCMSRGNLYRNTCYHYVSYVDSFSCSDCAINHFSDWVSFEKQASDLNVECLFVVAPKRNEINHVMEKLRDDTLLVRNVYVDTLAIFEKVNPSLPQNKLLHTFLLDNDNHVVLVGSPINNDNIEKLMRKIRFIRHFE